MARASVFVLTTVCVPAAGDPRTPLPEIFSVSPVTRLAKLKSDPFAVLVASYVLEPDKLIGLCVMLAETELIE